MQAERDWAIECGCLSVSNRETNTATHMNRRVEMNQAKRLFFLLPAMFLLPSGLELRAQTVDAETIIQRYLDAVGGREAIEKIHSRVAKGTFAMADMGMYAPFESYIRTPDRYRFRLDFAGMGSAENGVNGDIAWQTNPMAGPRILSGSERLAALQQARIEPLLNWRDFFVSAEASGPESLGDRSVYKVVFTPEKGSPMTCYFDADSGLLVRADVEQGGQRIQSEISDYREVDGVKVPFKMTMSGSQFRFELLVESVEHNVEIPDETFSLPAEIARLVEQP